MQDERQIEMEHTMAGEALRELVQNLLRCLSGGQAGSWHSIMGDIYKVAIADQNLREKGEAISSEQIRKVLAWERLDRHDLENMTDRQEAEYEADRYLERAYGSALRMVAYRISKTIEAQVSKTERDFLENMREREKALAVYRDLSNRPIPKKSPKRAKS